MSILVGASGALGFALDAFANKAWKLTSCDDPTNKFVGQFAAENVTENLGAQQQQTTSVGQQQPLIQFGAGEVETITFRARIFRASPISGAAFDALSNPVGTGISALQGNAGPLIGNGSVKDQIERIKSFSRKNFDLGRPERFLLQIGTEMEFEVFVRSPGGIVYDEIRSDGTIKGASLDINCVKTKPENLAQDAGVSTAAKIKAVAGVLTTVAGGISAIRSSRRDKLIDIPFGSLHTIDKFIVMKLGDTFESIALQEYGNANLGVILRNAQPDKLNVQPGEEIATVKKNEIVQIPITPTAVPLRDNAENKLLLEGFLALRGKPANLIV